MWDAKGRASRWSEPRWWSRIDGRLRLAVRVPVGATADVHVPGDDRSRVTAPDGARFLREEPEFVVFRVPHGKWEFTGRA